mgnify:CR=1 FL=1
MAKNNVPFKRRMSLTLRDMKRCIPLYLMIAPFMILFVVFVVYPVLMAIWYSFTDYNVLEKANFIGFDNYRKLFLDDDTFITAIKNTFIIAVIVGPGGYVLSFLLAWMINELPHKLGVVLTVIFYAPSMAGTAVVAVFRQIFSDDASGYLNAILRNLGITKEAILWLSDSKYVMLVVVLASLWTSLGVGFLSFVAGIKGVDEAQYEAGAIDGIKNRWQELWYITLPFMKPQLMFGAIMSITGSFGFGDTVSQLAGNPPVDYVGWTLTHHLGDYGSTRMEMGYASAIATVLFLIMMGANIVVQKLLAKVGQ